MSGKDEIPLKKMNLTSQIKSEIRIRTMSIYDSWEALNADLNIDSVGSIAEVENILLVNDDLTYQMSSIHGEEVYRRYLVDEVNNNLPVIGVYMSPKRNLICLLLFELEGNKWLAMGAVRLRERMNE